MGMPNIGFGPEFLMCQKLAGRMIERYIFGFICRHYTYNNSVEYSAPSAVFQPVVLLFAHDAYLL